MLPFVMNISKNIHTIRGQQVMLDKDLATLYEVEVKRLNEQVRRNTERFPKDFCFTLTEEENISLGSQIATLNKRRGKHSKYLPLVFTQEGIAALSGVLHSKIAIHINIQIMRAFVSMRQGFMNNTLVFNKFQQIDQKLLEHDSHFNQIFSALEQKELTPKQGIFYDGQVFDAHKFVLDLITSAKQKIIVIDNYVTEDTLALFCDCTVDVFVYTKEISKKLELSINKYNAQYKPIIVTKFDKSHDRFLIIDSIVYHLGASLKDLGTKWFAFSKMKNTSLLDKLS
jgi:hypothetical protein